MVQSVFALEPPREQDRRSDFVELYAAPISAAIDPAILRKIAVGLLNACQPDQRAQRCGALSCREQRGGALHQVARPDQMIAADLVVALDLAPRDAQRGDYRALEKLVLMREQHAAAESI